MSKYTKKIFMQCTIKLTTDLLKRYQNLDLIVCQIKFWHKYETKPGKTDITILGNRNLLRYLQILTSPQ